MVSAKHWPRADVGEWPVVAALGPLLGGPRGPHAARLGRAHDTADAEQHVVAQRLGVIRPAHGPASLSMTW
eukprot:3953784-Pyramimonas_sp.AAC.1